MEIRSILLAVATVLALGACASGADKHAASLESMPESERKEGLKECFKEENKSDKHDCIARHSPPEVGFECKRVQVTGTRFGERVCTTKTQREDVSDRSQETLRSVQRNSAATKIGSQ